ncbi:lysophospholipid acyltransferase family protein [Caldicellulosiruptor naganoensis]|uniref:1-acyl-sn-glycerol-3-phosphate acyltransferase n=1 Tax=Caldicellulosiruptor naganoensis TaxID=29324 RepID=A0ABY7BCS4_9FIRM|nr:lysophospholipid acyltransferase family protein [Caldicellulosiruptor naganoensis]WAM30638.1 1-acyl-sn-glycerol-3-phosphate acyltransferase [Caldicellulosiruptor naganoensis]
MKYNFFMNVIRKLAYLILKCVFLIKVEGKENIPKAPYIICANHRSYLDPVLIILIFDERVYFMAKSELFRIWWLSPIIRAFGAFPVRRGKSDISAIKKAIEVIRSNNILGIFPEGKRNRTNEIVLKGEKGVATIIKATGAKVLPVAICGKIRPLCGITVRIGKPLEFKNKDEDNQKIVDTIMQSIKDLILNTNKIKKEKRN